MPSAFLSTFRPLEEAISQILPEITAFRRDLHAHPELAYEEIRTAAKVAEALRRIPGMEVRENVGRTGVVGTLGRGKPGPAVALRADMDALPMAEESGVAYASTKPGIAHACGHDGHTAMLLGAARILGDLVDELQGPVRFLFQPAEEGGAGGRAMIEDGALRDPAVEAIFGLHNMPDPTTQAGQICLCPGAAMAGTGTFTITVEGVGGHAAAPHRCVDPIVIGSQIVGALQPIVSRETDPVASAVVSVTQFHAGTAFNVIPPEAVIKGTFRALDETVLEATQKAIVQRAEGVAAAFGATAKVQIQTNYPVLRNAPETDAIFREVVAAVGRETDFVEVPPIMGGEDFAFYQQEVPGTFWFLAARPADQESVPFCHHPAYDFNDELLADGIRFHVEVARRFAPLWKSAKSR
jgi:amidohydrolase